MTYLPDEILVKVDRATMAYGIEARVPLLDVRLVELAFPDRPRVAVRGRRAQGAPKADGAGLACPESVLTARKKGFSLPVGPWLSQPGKRDEVMEALRTGVLARAGWIDPDQVGPVTRSLSRPSFGILQLYLVERWARRWLSPDGISGRLAHPRRRRAPMPRTLPRDRGAARGHGRAARTRGAPRGGPSRVRAEARHARIAPRRRQRRARPPARSRTPGEAPPSGPCPWCCAAGRRGSGPRGDACSARGRAPRPRAPRPPTARSPARGTTATATLSPKSAFGTPKAALSDTPSSASTSRSISLG